MLNALADDLKQTKETLAKHYVSYNKEKLRAELHRIRGGISYLTLPELSKVLKSFHDMIKTETVNPNLSKPEKLQVKYEAVEQAIEHFFATWKNIST